MKRFGVIAILLLAFAGLSDSFYLARHETDGTPLICTVQNLSGCNVVAASHYSFILGVPVADFGIFYYCALFIIATLEVLVYRAVLRRALQALSVLGVLVSLYSTVVQVFFIQALCIYCLASALISLCVFIFATMIEPMRSLRAERARTPSTQSPRRDTLSMPPA